MKTIGIIGGLGPESTVDYYKRIIAAFRERYPDSTYPEIVLFSADLDRFMELVELQEWPTLVTWLTDRVEALHRAGADFAAIGSNTAHIVFDEVRAGSPIPLLSIVESACKRAGQLGVKTLGLMGTGFTMKADFYQKAFRARGMSVVVPGEEAQRLVQDRLFSEIELGIIKDSTRDELLAIVGEMKEKESIQALILGCTELPLILTRDEFGIPFLNTTAIHVDDIIDCCLAHS